MKPFVNVWAGSSVGRAAALQAVGHRFKPCSAYHFFKFFWVVVYTKVISEA